VIIQRFSGPKELVVSRRRYGGYMKSKKYIEKALRKLFETQYLAVLATQSGGHPYTNLVAFASTDDLKQLLFVTGQSTRKYANMKSDSRVAMLIDNRSNTASDVAEAMAATATGRTEDVLGDEREALTRLYLAKHPHLEEFATSPSTALIRLHVERYYVVNRFQNVTELHVA